MVESNRDIGVVSHDRCHPNRSTSWGTRPDSDSVSWLVRHSLVSASCRVSEAQLWMAWRWRDGLNPAPWGEGWWCGSPSPCWKHPPALRYELSWFCSRILSDSMTSRILGKDISQIYLSRGRVCLLHSSYWSLTWRLHGEQVIIERSWLTAACICIHTCIKWVSKHCCDLIRRVFLCRGHASWVLSESSMLLLVEDGFMIFGCAIPVRAFKRCCRSKGKNSKLILYRRNFPWI